MAAIFRLRHITGGPGSLQQHHVPGPMQGESQSTSTEGRQQQIHVPLLETIHCLLPLRRTLTTGEQGAPEALLQQLQRLNKAAEQHHRLTRIQQRSHQPCRCGKFELRCNPAKCCEHRQRFRIGSHLTVAGSTPKVLHHQIDAMVESEGFGI